MIAVIRLRFFLDQQSKFFQAILQRPERYAGSLGRLAPVAPELPQRRADGLLFSMLEDAFAWRLCRQAGQQFRWQFGRCYLSLGQDDGPFDDILQFTDVTGPAVLLQKRQGSGAGRPRLSPHRAMVRALTTETPVPARRMTWSAR